MAPILSSAFSSLRGVLAAIPKSYPVILNQPVGEFDPSF